MADTPSDSSEVVPFGYRLIITCLSSVPSAVPSPVSSKLYPPLDIRYSPLKWKAEPPTCSASSAGITASGVWLMVQLP